METPKDNDSQWLNIDDFLQKKDIANLFRIRMPTQEEMKKTAESRRKPLEWTTFLDYSEELKAHTFPFFIEKLPPSLVEWIYKESSDVQEQYGDFMEAFLEKSNLPQESFFMKLISRSPKDYLDESMELKGIDHSFEALTGSIRCIDDFAMLRHINKVYMVLRPYVEIPPREERRVFVKDGNIAGISQYFYDKIFDYSQKEQTEYEAKIRDFVDNHITPNMPLSSYVADVITGETMQLLESYDKLDGTIRTRQE